MPTKFAACPTEIVEAPIETVWKLVTNLAGWGEFYDVRVVRVEPPGPPAVGQIMFGHSGPRWLSLGVQFEITRMDDARHELELEVRIPLGLNVHEDLDCVALGPDRCRVNYHCNFAIPGGWRGVFIRIFLGRELVNGPIDSIGRLKRAAEKDHRAVTAGHAPVERS